MHLERVIAILETVSQQGTSSVSEVAEAVKLPRPTAYRLVQDLVNSGLLEQESKGRFTLGIRLKRITHADGTDRRIIEILAPVLSRAANDQGVTFFLSRLRGRAVEIIHAETPQTGVAFLHPGLGSRPLHACSCSKAVAAFLPEQMTSPELEGHLRRYTEFTLTHADDLKKEFALIRTRGYAECVEEIERGMCSVAAPLDHSGHWATISIGATGSVRVFTPAFRARMGALLVDMAPDLRNALPVGTTGAHERNALSETAQRVATN